MKKRYDIEGVMIDYLQILNVNMKGTNKEQQMGDVARRLKNLAKDLDIWVIALSQLNRDHQNPEPTLNRLRDSGQIAEAADIVCLVYRPEVYGRRYSGEFAGKETEGTAQLNFAKGRNIGMMKFLCGFDAATTNFYNVEEVQEGTCDTLPY
jgi:replicative DNA helicase